jgi:phage terminase large subunit
MAGRSLVTTMGSAFTPLFQKGYKHFALWGGRGTSKTHSVAAAIIILMARRNERVVCGRQYMASIKDSSYEILVQKIHAMGLTSSFRILDTEIEHVSTGSRATFIGLQVNPQSIKAIEGVTIFWVDEAQAMSQSALELAIPTFLRKPGSRLIFTWNPDQEDDPIEKYYRGPNPPPDCYIRHITQDDNPFFHQTELPAQMEHSRLADPRRFGHIWNGDYDVNADKRIYASVRIQRMEIPRHATRHFGMDFGYNDPNALVKVYHWVPRDKSGLKLFGKRPIIYVAQEAVGAVPLTELEMLMDSVTDVRDAEIFGDSSRPETIDFLRGLGFNMTPTKKGSGSIKNGIVWLQGHDIIIDPECYYAGREFVRYSWKVDRMGRILNVPEDKNNHTCDAVRYALESAIEMNATGDAMLNAGFTRVSF